MTWATSTIAGPSCESLWIARNAVFHEAGHCFSSRLGREVFGQGGCTTQITLTPPQKTRVANIQRQEVDGNCNVDQNQSLAELGLSNLGQYNTMRVQPVASGMEYACLGWKSGEENLYLNPQPKEGETPIYVIQPGDDLIFNDWNAHGFEFVSISRGRSATIARGWRRLANPTQGGDFRDTCGQRAG